MSHILSFSAIKRSVLPDRFKRSLSPTIAAFALCLLAAIVTSTRANAESAQQFLQPRVNWLKNHSLGYNYDYWIDLVFVSNDAPIPYLNNLQLASYGTAQLRLNPSPTLLSGSAKIYYSNKKTSTGNPFDQNQATTVTVTVNIITGQVTLGSVVIDAPQCLNGLMFGFCRPFLATGYYVLSFADRSEQIPN
jgi:hypothetical protein